jgi:hypothetical protein
MILKRLSQIRQSVPHLTKYDIDGFVLPGKMGPVEVLVDVFCHWWEGFAVNTGIACRIFAEIVVFFCRMEI